MENLNYLIVRSPKQPLSPCLIFHTINNPSIALTEEWIVTDVADGKTIIVRQKVTNIVLLCSDNRNIALKSEKPDTQHVFTLKPNICNRSYAFRFLRSES